MNPSKCYLVGDGSAVELDLDNVSLLLAAPQQLLLGVANDADGLAVLLHLGQVLLDLFLAEIVLPLQARLGECLLLGPRPVLRRSFTQPKINPKRGREGRKRKTIRHVKNPGCFITIIKTVAYGEVNGEENLDEFRHVTKTN